MLKTIARKSLCIVLATGVICSAFSGSHSQAAKKAALKTKKMSMKVGQSKKVAIKNRNKKAVYRFVSSSPKKASVSKSGVIKAKKTGTVKITVTEKIKKKTRKLGKVTVQIKAKDTKKEPTVTNAPTTPSTVPATAAPASAAPASAVSFFDAPVSAFCRTGVRSPGVCRASIRRANRSADRDTGYDHETDRAVCRGYEF